MKLIEIYERCHNLWQIEELCKIMKSDLDARISYMKTENTIKGYFHRILLKGILHLGC